MPARIGDACASDVLPQRHDRKEADDADGDEGAFNDTGDDIAEGEVLVLPFEDRKQLFLGELIWTLFRWWIDGGRLEPVPWLRQRSRHLTLRLSAPVTAESTSEHTARRSVLLAEQL